jgi:hypothetical protein
MWPLSRKRQQLHEIGGDAPSVRLQIMPANCDSGNPLKLQAIDEGTYGAKILVPCKLPFELPRGASVPPLAPTMRPLLIPRWPAGHHTNWPPFASVRRRRRHVSTNRFRRKRASFAKTLPHNDAGEVDEVTHSVGTAPRQGAQRKSPARRGQVQVQGTRPNWQTSMTA